MDFRGRYWLPEELVVILFFTSRGLRSHGIAEIYDMKFSKAEMLPTTILHVVSEIRRQEVNYGRGVDPYESENHTWNLPWIDQMLVDWLPRRQVEELIDIDDYVEEIVMRVR